MMINQETLERELKLDVGETVCLNSGGPNAKIIALLDDGRFVVEWQRGMEEPGICALPSQCFRRVLAPTPSIARF